MANVPRGTLQPLGRFRYHLAMPTDRDRLLAMLAAHHPCISITSYEEDHALDVVRQAAMEDAEVS